MTLAQNIHADKDNSVKIPNTYVFNKTTQFAEKIRNKYTLDKYTIFKKRVRTKRYPHIKGKDQILQLHPAGKPTPNALKTVT